MENKILEQENINNLSKSFNLNELHRLINVSFNNFKKGKEYKQKNDLDNSFKKFHYSNNILNQLDQICQNNQCNQEIRNKIKKAIKNINDIIEKDININKKQGGSALENNTNTIHEVLLPGYSGIEETVTDKLSLKQNALAHIPTIEDVKENLQNTVTNLPSNEEIKTNIQNKIDQLNNKKNTHHNLFSLINEKYKQEINKYFIQPLNYPELYKKNFNSILLYGYKGNGKSFIVTQSLKKINNKNIIQKYINIKQLVEDESLLNSVFSELSSFIETEKNEKIIIIIEDLDILNTKDNQENFYEMIYKYSQQDNIFIIATSNKPWKLNMNINNIFEKKILIGFPDIEDINKYFVYKLFQYLEIENIENFNHENLENIIEHKKQIFNIPILNSIKYIHKISKKCLDNKCSYYDLNIIINKLFNISAISAIKNNIFQKEKLDKIYFINSSAILSNNFNEKNTYLLNPPQYNYINYKETKYKTYNYSSYGISIDDERITNYYVNEKQLLNQKEEELDIIGEVDIKISNNTNNETNQIVTDINKIILNIYIYLFKNILFNVSNIITNDKTIYKKLNDIITANINEINKIENLDDFLFLDDNIKNKIINLFPRKEIINNYNQFKNTYSGCLNTLIQTINLENKNYSYNIIYNNKNSNMIEGYEQGISSDMDNPNKFRDIIVYLLSDGNNTINGIPFDVQIVYLKKENNFSWTIEILPDYKSNDKLILQLFQIQIIDSTNKYDVSPSIDLPFDSIELNYNYKITNESDVFLLQENFPQDYQEIYKDEPNTWLLKKIKKNEHLEYLQKTYNGYQKFFLNLYYNLLKYKKTCWNYINTKCQQKLDSLLKDIEIRIENILYITQDYDESVEKEIDKWKISDNHRNYHQDDENEENTNNIQNYSVNFMVLKQLLNIMGNFNSIQEIMEYYEKSVNGIYLNKNEKIYIKSKIKKKKIEKFYYSNYLNENKIAENSYYDSNYFEILKNKIIKRESFYFELFINAEEIGILKNNNIQWYDFNNVNNDIYIFLKSADFAISNRTIDFVNSVFKNLCNPEMYNNMLAYIISSLYITEYNIDNILKLYIGIILYNKNLLINVNNQDLKQNFIELLENNVLDHFSFIKEIFTSIKKELKNISIPKIPERKKIFNEKNTSSITENDLCFTDNLVSENENIKRKKKYSEIVEKKLGYNIKEINSSLKSFNIKIEYLNEIIKVYKCYHNIEAIHLLEKFQ